MLEDPTFQIIWKNYSDLWLWQHPIDNSLPKLCCSHKVSGLQKNLHVKSYPSSSKRRWYHPWDKTSKLVFFRLCDEQLSNQSHYDFGLRALKSVLISAGNVKRDRIQRIKEGMAQRGETNIDEASIAENLPEQEILIQSVCETMVPKLVAEDIPLLFSLLNDVFPNVLYTRAEMKGRFSFLGQPYVRLLWHWNLKIYLSTMDFWSVFTEFLFIHNVRLNDCYNKILLNLLRFLYRKIHSRTCNL